jgi:hypothetical protein
MSKADYTYQFKYGVLCIEDLDLGRMSVTNCIEDCIEEICKKEGISLQVSIEEPFVIYRDSDGIWDGFDWKTQSFFSIGVEDLEEALQKLPGIFFPTDVKGRKVKLGDKVRGEGAIKFQDGFSIDRSPIVTANIQNKRLYFGNLSRESFDRFLIVD